MTLPERLCFSELLPVAWQNGGGVTREVARQEGDGKSPGWRVSVAELDREGPFSIIAGVRRHFTVIGEYPVTLVLPDQRAVLAPRESFIFEGEAAVNCLLPEGPSRALNLMYNPANWQASVRWLTSGGPLRQAPSAETLILAVDGQAWLVGESSLPITSGDIWHWPRLNAAYELATDSGNTMTFETLPATHLIRVDLSPRV
ncbi:HutD family protein [Halomonas sp. QX-2]|uniref:HutD family protein n=1 Tax=Vreelandella sedimenti TaxID=2729618 RepID=A0A7Z0SLW4_9GAMM|nr:MULTISPECIES: HutD family protein [Halomonas]NYT71558.1 HutD family protein [Halomonas sedimenti]|tara:strand:+ start:104193 stop:104795 length:603 start_codon:yes stop_codon:yes gene_type:complete